MPPDLFDAEEGKTYSSNPQTPSEGFGTPLSPSGLASGLEAAINSGNSTGASISPASPASPITPSSPGAGPGATIPFRRGHGRQASLGTTKTSPSTRRRSIETTITMIQEAMDGKEGEDGAAVKPAIASGTSSPRA